MPPDTVPPGTGPIACWRLDLRGVWESGILSREEGAERWDWDPGAGPEDVGANHLRALWTPPMLDAHTHLGDAFIRPEREKLPRDITALVAPPNGYKHRRLAEADPDEMVAAMHERAEVMVQRGTQLTVDFREGGANGLGLLRDAVKETSLAALALARPASPTAEPDAWAHEAEALVKGTADGLGMSGMRDIPASLLDTAADACKRLGKRLGLHLAEHVHEPMDAALALEPTLLVHLVETPIGEMADLADAEVLAVTCPTSNRFFDLRAPLDRLYATYKDHGLATAVGTDNAMLSDGGLRHEAIEAADRVPAADLEWLITSLTATPWRHLGLDPSPGALGPGILWGVDAKAPGAHPAEVTLRNATRFLGRPVRLAPPVR
ncbi:MAG: amidohydrolase family protein [Euryarchaeota archaeon]|nr:amidohydrolase family protein [Euryarchaeota archaeon]